MIKNILHKSENRSAKSTTGGQDMKQIRMTKMQNLKKARTDTDFIGYELIRIRKDICDFRTVIGKSEYQGIKV